MILSALVEYDERIKRTGRSDVARPGFSPESISFVLVLSSRGELVRVDDIRDLAGKKPRGVARNVPQPPKRSSGIAPCLMWDKTSYVLGVKRDVFPIAADMTTGSDAAIAAVAASNDGELARKRERLAAEHRAFRSKHFDLLADTDDIGLVALREFLISWTAEQYLTSPVLERYRDAMPDTNLVFRLDGDRGFIHERPAAGRLVTPVNSQGADDAASPVCLVTGRRAPPARLHPSIKGVQGAQTAGASIVSFNQEAFESFGRKQGTNAPVSETATLAYTSALNHLLRRHKGGDGNAKRNLLIGDATVVFWALADDPAEADAAEQTLESAIDAPTDAEESKKVESSIVTISRGHAVDHIDPRLNPATRMFVLGLAPNASRLSIRYWQQGSLQFFAERLARHYDDLRLEPVRWKMAPSIWRLSLTLAPSRQGKAKVEDIPPQMAGELMRAVLTGLPYPRSVLATLLMRMRADGDVSDLRVALIRAVMTRAWRAARAAHPPRSHDPLSQQEIPVSLDLLSMHPGYRLGRLFAVLEDAQRGAIGKDVNATIRDRYWGAASATPASIFPTLMRNAQHHLGTLRRDKKTLNVAQSLERKIGEIVGGLGDRFPRSLGLDEQGRFALGYYHQRWTMAKRTGDPVASEADTDDGDSADGSSDDEGEAA